MNVTHLLNLTGTLIAVTDGDVDEYGDPGETTTETTVHYWVDRSDARGDSSETIGSQSWQTAVLDLYLPPGTSVTGVDRFRDQSGVVFEVLGPPHTHTHPRTGAAVYIGAQIKRVS